MLTGAIATIIFTRGVPCVIRFDVLEEENAFKEARKSCGQVLSEPASTALPKGQEGCGNAPGQLVWLGCGISTFTPATYQRHRL